MAGKMLKDKEQVTHSEGLSLSEHHAQQDPGKCRDGGDILKSHRWGWRDRGRVLPAEGPTGIRKGWRLLGVHQAECGDCC